MNNRVVLKVSISTPSEVRDSRSDEQLHLMFEMTTDNIREKKEEENNFVTAIFMSIYADIRDSKSSSKDQTNTE